jgi:1-acyl-sn-glycerol-3-phosphate acyltransferase
VILRTIWVWVFSTIVTFSLSALTVIGSLLGGREKFYNWIERTWGSLILWSSGVKVEVQGLENVRLDQPQIVASNHQSWYDVFALAAHMPKKFRFVAKEELGRIPVFGHAWRAAGHISVNRKDRLQAIRALEHFGNVVREDNSIIVIFPEGTRSPTGELLPFKKGAFMLALHTHVDIVPTAVIGSRAIQKKGDWRVRSGSIIVRFGKPIPTTGYTEDNRDQLITLVRDRVHQLLTQPESA